MIAKTVQANWRDVILVCRKCSNKLDGGFGKDGDTSLAKTLKRRIRDAAPSDRKHKGRHAAVGVVEVGCLGVCPKRAVTTVLASRPQEWQIVPQGTAADEVLNGLPFGSGSDADKGSHRAPNVVHLRPTPSRKPPA